MHGQGITLGDCRQLLPALSIIVLQFVLVLDDGVADVKRENLHVF